MKAAQEKSSGTRQRILDTASRLFYQQGYNLTGINQLIEEAQVAKASLYQHFSSKDDLLLAYLSQKSREWFTQLQEHVASYSSPKEKILATFDLLENFSNQVQCQGCNFQNAASEVPLTNEKVRTLIKNHKEGMRRFFAQVMEPTGQEAMADEVYLLFEGALISTRVLQSSWPVQTARKMIERIV